MFARGYPKSSPPGSASSGCCSQLSSLVVGHKSVLSLRCSIRCFANSGNLQAFQALKLLEWQARSHRKPKTSWAHVSGFLAYLAGLHLLCLGIDWFHNIQNNVTWCIGPELSIWFNLRFTPRTLYTVYHPVMFLAAAFLENKRDGQKKWGSCSCMILGPLSHTSCLFELL